MSSKENNAAESLLMSLAVSGLPDYASDEDTPVESDSEDEAPDQELGTTYSRLDAEESVEDVPPGMSQPNKDALDKAGDNANAGDEDAEGNDQPGTSAQATRKWKKRNAVTDKFAFDEEENCCKKDEFENASCPTDFFLTFFNAEIRDKILFETNQYAVQKGRNFSPLLDHELLGFVGINFFMGYHRLPSWRDYWCCDEDLHAAVVAESMPRKRFGDILANLHCNNNLAIPADNTDRLFKLRPLVDGLNKRFAYLYHMGKHQSIDESMILFKGRSTLKQYNPMKPIKRGYKLWTRADNSGYIGQFQVYQGKGKDGSDNENQDIPAGYGLGEKVIHQFTRPLVGKNYEVYFDNYFTSIPLLEDLRQDGVLACGTIRANRKHLPSLKSDKELKERGMYDYRFNEKDVAAFRWKDNKAIMVASNFHGSEETTVRRTMKDGTKIDVPSPTAIADYNKNMGGVDKADMLRSFYAVNRKSVKWWQRIFWGVLDIAFVNSYVVYQSVNGKMPVLQYRRKVTMGLLTLGKQIPQAKKRGRPSSPAQAALPKRARPSSPAVQAAPGPSKSNKRRKGGYSVAKDVRLQNVGCHMPDFVAQRGRCEVCSVNGVESRPHCKCSTCKVFLCANEKKNCFVAYHTT